MDDWYQFLNTIEMHQLGPGRDGIILVPTTDPDKMPLVRSTTDFKYSDMSAIKPLLDHHHLCLDLESNPDLNIMVERYGPEYTKMRYHTDCSLDLIGTIKIIAFYPDLGRRTLHVKEKKTGIVSTMTLQHGSIFEMSLDFNSRNLHKISGNSTMILVTIRRSKTIGFKPNVSDFYKQKYLENKTDGMYTWTQ